MNEQTFYEMIDRLKSERGFMERFSIEDDEAKQLADTIEQLQRERDGAKRMLLKYSKQIRELYLELQSMRGRGDVMRAERERDEALDRALRAESENDSLRVVLCAAAEPFRADYPDEWRTMAVHRINTLRDALAERGV